MSCRHELRDVAVLTEPLTIAEKAGHQIRQFVDRLPWLKLATPEEVRRYKSDNCGPGCRSCWAIGRDEIDVGRLGDVRVRAGACSESEFRHRRGDWREVLLPGDGTSRDETGDSSVTSTWSTRQPVSRVSPLRC